MKTYLDEYAEQVNIIDEAQDRIKVLKQILEAEVRDNGIQEGAGYKARIKKGRSYINHEKAVTDAKVPESIINRFTKTTSTVSWAKVTSETGLNLADYTTQGDPSFVIEKLK